MSDLKEINEYLAEHLFGHEIEHCEIVTNKCTNANCNNCERDSDYCPAIRDYIPDYISNYQPVLEKLIELGWSITRLSQVVDNGILIKNQYICEINHSYLTSYQYRGCGETIGEAVCKAAVEYLKAREGYLPFIPN